MITFFRKLRASLLSIGKTGKYLKYAIGEILLVVIGILIAVQINNWNETRKEQWKAITFLVKMREEIKTDINYLLERDSLYAIMESNSDKAIEKFYLAKTVKDILIADSLYTLTWRDFPINRSTYDEMLGTGSFYTLKNKTLQDKIVSYYSLAESVQYSTKTLNNHSQEIFRNPDLNSFRFLIDASNHSDYHKIDTSWIGNVNAPTYLALNYFYRASLNAIINRRNALQYILNRSNELLHEIENEISK